MAVDTYCWLHKGVFGCAEKILRGEKTDAYIQYCLKQLEVLITYDIKPILVFDGRNLPAKQGVEEERRKSRKDAKERVKELLAQGRTSEARQQMQRAIDVTHEMALELIKECRQRNIDCIVSPYEADGQLAYLNLTDVAQFVITEDSDLVLFGCKKILFKFSFSGGLLFESDKLHLTIGCHPDKFTFTSFRRMCILSGCDYLKSLNGIGLAKAKKFFSMTEETDMRRALGKIPSYLNMRNLIITDEYKEGFLRAEATFQHMIVYNPFKRCLTRINPVDENIDQHLLENAGEFFDERTAFQLALGNLNPKNLKKLDDWNPDHSKIIVNSKLKTSKQISIWKTQIQKPPSPKRRLNLEERNSTSIFKITANYTKKQEETEIAQLEENIIESYLQNDSPLRSPKLKRQKLETPPSEQKSSKNPFKKLLTSPSCNATVKITEQSSLLIGVKDTETGDKENLIKSSLFNSDEGNNDENSFKNKNMLEELRKKLYQAQNIEKQSPKSKVQKNIFECSDSEIDTEGQESHETSLHELHDSSAINIDDKENVEELDQPNISQASKASSDRRSLSDSMLDRLEPNVIIEESETSIIIIDDDQPNDFQQSQTSIKTVTNKSTWKAKASGRASGLSKNFSKLANQHTLSAFGFTSSKK